MDWSPEQLAGIERLRREHGLRLVLAFGSTVSGRTHARSDLDLAVLSDDPGPPSLERMVALESGLEALLPGPRIDLAWLDHADPLFLKKVAECCRLLAGEPRDFQALRLRAWKRYQDFRPRLRAERDYVARYLHRHQARAP